ncbi:ABC transporter ATP-binding protein [Falsiroseomonas sp. CW058]|uniref:ABC transporter ATP-binding protein n=1 Tax=Falsiroseomonas sp. CW058 TaxID=3388664 RepID=UPI003D316F2E
MRASADPLLAPRGADAAPPFLSLRGVAKTYRAGGRETVAIGDVTFDVAEGELLALVGPSGCGKSTLLKILAGLHGHDAGQLRIGDAGFDPGRDIGVAFQQPLLLKWRRVLDNVLLPAEILGLPMAAARDRARDLLALVGLAGTEGKYPYELSGGMQQRVSLARALVHDPKLVLLDEPFGALDALTRERMNLELRRIWAASRKTVVLVTHGVQEAVFCATRVAVLTAGPARMADFFAVDLPEPRELAVRNTPEFGALARRVYERLGMT